MAKMTALEILNAVLRKVGEVTVSSLTSLSTIQQIAFDNINESLEEIAQDGDLKPLEGSANITLVTGTSTYTSTAADYRSLAVESPTQSDSNRNIIVLTPDEWNIRFPKGITSDRTGYPKFMTEMFDKFHLDRVPTANENGKTIAYRYFKIPTLLSTATSSGTCYMPEGYDRTLLVAHATWKTMEYMGHPEAMNHYVKVFGDGGNRSPEGLLSKFKSQFRQPTAKVRFTAPI